MECWFRYWICIGDLVRLVCNSLNGTPVRMTQIGKRRRRGRGGGGREVGRRKEVEEVVAEEEEKT